MASASSRPAPPPPQSPAAPATSSSPPTISIPLDKSISKWEYLYFPTKDNARNFNTQASRDAKISYDISSIDSTYPIIIKISKNPATSTNLELKGTEFIFKNQPITEAALQKALTENNGQIVIVKLNTLYNKWATLTIDNHNTLINGTAAPAPPAVPAVPTRIDSFIEKAGNLGIT